MMICLAAEAAEECNKVAAINKVVVLKAVEAPQNPKTPKPQNPKTPKPLFNSEYNDD